MYMIWVQAELSLSKDSGVLKPLGLMDLPTLIGLLAEHSISARRQLHELLSLSDTAEGSEADQCPLPPKTLERVEPILHLKH